MKKFFAVLLAIALCAGAFTGCGSTESSDDTLSIVVTIFPEYDWVKQILGDTGENADVTLLLDSGADLHNYQPTAADIVKISNCDLFVYVGGESDEWVEDVLAQAQNEDMVVLNLMEILGDRVQEEETVEGMQTEAEEEHGEAEMDEHVWLSLKNAEVVCGKIGEVLSILEPENAETYAANAQAYCEQLNALDEQYRQVIGNAGCQTLLFGDRFPFRYLVEDYGLNYYAAFSGCSAESEASFDTVVFLADKLQELGLSSVMILEGSDGKLAQTILDTAGSDAAILTMDSMQTITHADADSGVTYLSIMEQNMEVLGQALN